MTTERTPVLIVGGSVVGASAALFLAARGVTPILVEKHPAVSTRLRAKLFYPRTMTAYRAVGVADDVYAVERTRPPADHGAVVASLAGPELRRWLLPAAADFSAVSPSPSALVKQADLEAVVRTAAARSGADLRFGHRLLDFRADGDTVTARIADQTGNAYEVTAAYLIAADGNRSGIREALGLGRTEIGGRTPVLEIDFDGDLRPVLAGRRLALAWTPEPGRATLSWTTEHDRGAVSVRWDSDDPPSDDQCRTIVSRALGRPPAAFTLTGIRRWEMAGWVADAYRAGPVFLVGDAAHVTPPTGGFGANTGIQDAWNLTAKLVSVLRGDAGPRLLDDYEPERRAVGTMTVRQAVRRMQNATGGPPSEAAVALGYRYDVPGGDPTLPETAEPASWRGEPGTQLPHRWLPGARSTLDLVTGGRYLLLAGPAGADWTAAARAADPAGAFLDATVLPPEVDDPGTGPLGAMLIRPDHVVAWRTTGTASPRALNAALRTALRLDGGGVTVRPEAGGR
jgi:putative polyketide hydroxylase